MTLIEMLRANGSWEADAAASKLQSQADRIEKLEAALRDCMDMAEVHEIPFRDRVMYISDVARKALEGKDD
jgi:hypothetical protein